MLKSLFLSFSMVLFVTWLMRFLLLESLFLFDNEYFVKSAFADYFIPQDMYHTGGIVLMAFSQIWMKALGICILVLIGAFFFKNAEAYLKTNVQMMLLGGFIFIGFACFACLRTLWISPDSETLELMKNNFGIQHANEVFYQSSILAFSKLGEWFAAPAMIFIWFRLRKNTLTLG